jgi:hypothetical protein
VGKPKILFGLATSSTLVAEIWVDRAGEGFGFSLADVGKGRLDAGGNGGNGGQSFFQG